MSKCHHCGKDTGMNDPPSGVCSVACLNAAQGFSPIPQETHMNETTTTPETISPENEPVNVGLTTPADKLFPDPSLPNEGRPWFADPDKEDPGPTNWITWFVIVATDRGRVAGIYGPVCGPNNGPVTWVQYAAEAVRRERERRPDLTWSAEAIHPYDKPLIG